MPTYSCLPVLRMKHPSSSLRPTFSLCKRSQPLWLTGRSCSQNSSLLTSVLPSPLLDLSHHPTNNHSLILKIIPPLTLPSPLLLPSFLHFTTKFKKLSKLSLISFLLTLEFTSIRPYLQPFYLNYIPLQMTTTLQNLRADSSPHLTYQQQLEQLIIPLTNISFLGIQGSIPGFPPISVVSFAVISLIHKC